MTYLFWWSVSVFVGVYLLMWFLTGDATPWSLTDDLTPWGAT